jgi:maleamate amidohydrolase
MVADNAQELKSWFVGRGLSGRMGFGRRPALVVIDAQRGFTDPQSGLGAEAGEMIEKIREIVEHARAAAVPVYYTICVWDESAEVWAKKIPAQRTLLKGSKWARLDPRLTARDGEVVIEKNFASAFFGTDLHAQLQERHVDTVILTGMTTSGCVRASAVDACSYGYHAIVPADAVADRAAQAHEASLFDLDVKYADVTSSASVCQHLTTLPFLPSGLQEDPPSGRTGG